MFLRNNGEMIRIEQENNVIFHTFLSNYGFKGTVVNWVLPFVHGGSLEFMFTVSKIFDLATKKQNLLKHLNSNIRNRRKVVASIVDNPVLTTFAHILEIIDKHF